MPDDEVFLAEIRVTLTVPSSLPEGEVARAVRTLFRRSFLDHLRRAVEDRVRQHPSLAPVRVAVSH